MVRLGHGVLPAAVDDYDNVAEVSAAHRNALPKRRFNLDTCMLKVKRNFRRAGVPLIAVWATHQCSATHTPPQLSAMLRPPDLTASVMFWYACMLAARPCVTAPTFCKTVCHSCLLTRLLRLLRLLRHIGWSRQESGFVTSTALLRTA